MGFRGALKSSGGFWNNCDATITGYEFTTVSPGANGTAGEWIYLVPSVRVDGADADTTQHLFMGGADRYEISKDGQSIESADGGNVTIGANTPAGKFLDSLINAGFPEGNLPDLEAGEALELSAIVDTRIRLKQEKDVEGTAKRGKQKSKDGKKEYDRTNTVVSNVYNLPTTGKSTSASKSVKPAGKGKAAASTDIRDKADAAVIALCEAAVDKKNAQGTIPTTKLSVGVLRLLSGDNDKEAVRKMVNDAAYLADAVERGVIAHDSDENTVSLAE